MAAGFENFIIADPALMLYLRQQKINCGIHLSGETAEVNRGMLEQMLPFGIRRVIFTEKIRWKICKVVLKRQISHMNMKPSF